LHVEGEDGGVYTAFLPFIEGGLRQDHNAPPCWLC
jgi:hypothetical protein